jgi:hypothetical protein
MRIRDSHAWKRNEYGDEIPFNNTYET